MVKLLLTIYKNCFKNVYGLLKFKKKKKIIMYIYPNIQLLQF